jgi:Type IV secretion system pilin
MKTLRKTLHSMTTAAAIALLPLVVFAQTQSGSNSGYLTNPTAGAGIGSIQDFIAAFLKAVVEISLPILTLFIVYSGFMFVTARGNPEKLRKARENFLYVIIGAILILGAWVLATLIASTATQVLGTS